jgi:hypothetical protein
LVVARCVYSPARIKQLRSKKYPVVEEWRIAIGRGWRSVSLYESVTPPPVHILERAAELLDVHPGKFFAEVTDGAVSRKRRERALRASRRQAVSR